MAQHDRVVVDVEDYSANAVLPDFRLGKVETDQRLRIDRGPELSERHTEGEVRRADEKTRAGEIARAAPGVKDVANGLQIDSGQ